MKPGDHPEFFLRPAPAGASRESQIVLRADGQFLHEGEVVERASLREALFSWVDVHPHDRRVILQNGYDWVYLTVEDTPFFIRAIRAQPAALDVTLAGGREAVVSPALLSVDDEGMLFAEVLGQQARFLREAQLAMAPWLDADADGVICLQLAEQRTPIRRRIKRTPHDQ